ncbi:MAG: hypothetical protein Q8P25_05135 [Candidatus Curtissbacteria bacterium]|nr:hypothetical protein [Candidatus Curtissbacteria bacterium]
MESSNFEIPKNPETSQKEIAPKPESIKNKHFEYTLVFGQGPVQEQDNVPQSGRQGLNFYSRMTALAASQMLKIGITEKVVLSGGATGARAGTPEAQTEAELMADIIRKKLTTLSPDGNSYIANGKVIPLKDTGGADRPKAEIDNDVAQAFADKILIENESKDTLQNFSLILNKYLDQPGQEEASMALLGIGFHAKDTYNGTGTGRLEVLKDIFRIKGTVYSVEEVINDLLIDQERSSPRKKLSQLTQLAQDHDISQMKSIQEQLLIEGLNSGEWLKAIPILKSEKRIKDMITNNQYVQKAFEEQFGLQKEDVLSMSLPEIIARVQEVKVKGTAEEEYGAIKTAIFEVFSQMTDEKGTDYLKLYGKGTTPK